MMKTSRRNFLKVSTLATGGFMMAINMPGNAAFLNGAGTDKAFDLNALLRIDLNGNIRFLLTRHEMGQGTGTGLPMILADELGADWSKLTIERSDFDTSFKRGEMGTTGGSGTIRRMWGILRDAGATAREMLKQAAAEQWKVDAKTLNVKNSYVINPANGESLEFGQLAEKASKLKVPEEVKLKEKKDFDIIGTPTKNLITNDVVVGNGNYGINMNVPGMVYAAIHRCPVYKGKLKSFDDSVARKVTGVIDVIAVPSLEPESDSNHVQEGVAVIANSTWSAFKAKKLLKIEWDNGKNGKANNKSLMQAFDKAIIEKKEPVFSKGDITALSKDNNLEVFEAEYTNPYQAHALMEPINATAHFKGTSCEIWVGTQNGQRVMNEVAKVIGLDKEKVTVHILNSGGAFGRRAYADAPMEAAYLSMKMNLPVKLTWSREDEISHDYFHPTQKSYHKAFINKEKKIIGWETKMIKTDDGAHGDNLWEIPYAFQNIETSFYDVESIVHTGAWRSVGVHSSSLGRESFIDELAAKLNKDPLEFRLELIKEDVQKVKMNLSFASDDLIFDYRTMNRTRYREVLKTIKEKGLWPKKPLPKGKGIGLAIDDFSRTTCAHVVEVSVDNDNYNGFRVDKVTSVVHCGTLVNPHFGRGQIEGSIVFALSALKYGGIEVKDGIVQRDNFHDNLLLRIDETPEIDVHFIDSDDNPSGLGEPGTPPLAPAVLNAIYSASGKRIRKIPVMKEDIIGSI